MLKEEEDDDGSGSGSGSGEFEWFKDLLARHSITAHFEQTELTRQLIKEFRRQVLMEEERLASNNEQVKEQMPLLETRIEKSIKVLELLGVRKDELPVEDKNAIECLARLLVQEGVETI